MSKIARKINLDIVVVVSSVPQLLSVLGTRTENLSISRKYAIMEDTLGKALRIMNGRTYGLGSQPL